jgi:hypothetical protein
MKKISLRGFGLFGIVLFAPLFILTFADPNLIERSAKTFITWKLQSETDKKIDSVQLPVATKLERLLGDKAKKLRQQAEQKLILIKQQLKADAPSILAAQLTKLSKKDCECRKKWAQRLRHLKEMELASLQKAKAKLIDFSHAKYMEITQKLTLDVRIFLGTNSVIFVLLLLISFMKPAAISHLFLPGGLLLISTLISSYFYLFEQNWFYTILYNDYTGFSFIGYLLLVFAVLCDIVFNKARVTTTVINACLEAVGQAASLVSC